MKANLEQIIEWEKEDRSLLDLNNLVRNGRVAEQVKDDINWVLSNCFHDINKWAYY